MLCRNDIAVASLMKTLFIILHPQPLSQRERGARTLLESPSPLEGEGFRVRG